MVAEAVAAAAAAVVAEVEVANRRTPCATKKGNPGSHTQKQRFLENEEKNKEGIPSPSLRRVLECGLPASKARGSWCFKLTNENNSSNIKLSKSKPPPSPQHQPSKVREVVVECSASGIQAVRTFFDKIEMDKLEGVTERTDAIRQRIHALKRGLS